MSATPLKRPARWCPAPSPLQQHTEKSHGPSARAGSHDRRKDLSVLRERRRRRQPPTPRRVSHWPRLRALSLDDVSLGRHQEVFRPHAAPVQGRQRLRATDRGRAAAHRRRDPRRHARRQAVARVLTGWTLRRQHGRGSPWVYRGPKDVVRDRVQDTQRQVVCRPAQGRRAQGQASALRPNAGLHGRDRHGARHVHRREQRHQRAVLRVGPLRRGRVRQAEGAS